jgi:hypothetical protein
MSTDRSFPNVTGPVRFAASVVNRSVRLSYGASEIG